MKSFIFYFFYNWRTILNLWIVFIVVLLAIVTLKPKISINIKKSGAILVICIIYTLLNIFAYYVIGNISLNILSNVFISVVLFGIGIILYVKYQSEKLTNNTVKYAAIVLLFLSLIDVIELYIKILIKLVS
ncbi:hypothetical protein ACO3TA_02275 [Methanocaldococcus sp. 28A]